MNRKEVKQYVETHSKLVLKKKQAPNVNVLKYHNRVFYKNLWDRFLVEFRGTVVDDDYNIIQRPFTKIFNYGVESRAPEISDEEVVTVSEKINGFMAAATWHEGKVFVSTTGSISSDFVDLARKWIDLDYLQDMYRINSGYTLIFEIVDPSDPHIVEEVPGAYLLALRAKYWDAPQRAMCEYDLNQIAKMYSLKRPFTRVASFGEIKKWLYTTKREGCVCWTEDGRETKMKSPYYLVTKFLGRMSEKHIEDRLNDTAYLRKVLDEEFYPIVDYIAANKEEFMSKTPQERIEMVRETIEELLK